MVYIWYVWDTIVILEEGNRPYPRCPKCDMFLSHKALNGQHLAIAFCRRGEGRKRCRLVEEEVREGKERDITAYGIPLALVTSFKYLGSVLSTSDDNCPAVVHNLWRAHQKWARLSRVLSREGSDARTLGRIFCGGGSGGHALWVGDVGNDTMHWEGFGQIPPQGGPKADRETTPERTGLWMGVSPTGGTDGGGRITRVGYLCLPPP